MPAANYICYMRPHEQKLTAQDLPEIVGQVAATVYLTEEFCALARAWNIPKETLASYVCQQFGNTYRPEQPLILLTDRHPLFLDGPN